MKLNEIIGKRIKYIRTEKGISQEELAEAADITTNYIGQIERGQRNPTLSILENIASALGITFSELFNEFDYTVYPSIECISEVTDIIMLLETFTPEQLHHIHRILKELDQLANTKKDNKKEYRIGETVAYAVLFFQNAYLFT